MAWSQARPQSVEPPLIPLAPGMTMPIRFDLDVPTSCTITIHEVVGGSDKLLPHVPSPS